MGRGPRWTRSSATRRWSGRAKSWLPGWAGLPSHLAEAIPRNGRYGCREVRMLRPTMNSLVLAAAAAGLAVGIVLWPLAGRTPADWLFAATAALGFVTLLGSTARSLYRRSASVDLVALLAIAGAMALGEFLAGAVIALMLSSGRALEDSA